MQSRNISRLCRLNNNLKKNLKLDVKPTFFYCFCIPNFRIGYSRHWRVFKGGAREKRAHSNVAAAVRTSPNGSDQARSAAEDGAAPVAGRKGVDERQTLIERRRSSGWRGVGVAADKPLNQQFQCRRPCDSRSEESGKRERRREQAAASVPHGSVHARGAPAWRRRPPRSRRRLHVRRPGRRL